MLQIICILALIFIANVPKRIATHTNPATIQTISSHSIPMVDDLTRKQMVIFLLYNLIRKF